MYPSSSPPIAILTGASRGTGRGIAVTLGRHGCRVYATGRPQQAGDHALTDTIHEIPHAVAKEREQSISAACDHASNDQVHALFDVPPAAAAMHLGLAAGTIPFFRTIM